MSDPSTKADPALSKHRLEALSDGVFAVVLTLLVLELKPELPAHATSEDVMHALRELTPSLFGYAFAFGVISIFWSLHHRKFILLRHTNGLHTALTLGFLFAVTLLPLSTSIYLRAKVVGIAQGVYFLNYTLIAVTLLASWLYASRTGLTDLAAAPQNGQALTRRMVSMSLLGVIACVATWSAQTWILILAIPVIFWVRFRRAKTS